MHFDTASLDELALRLDLALVLGSAIGIERQWQQKMSGLRTNALVQPPRLLSRGQSHERPPSQRHAE